MNKGKMMTSIKKWTNIEINASSIELTKFDAFNTLAGICFALFGGRLNEALVCW